VAITFACIDENQVSCCKILFPFFSLITFFANKVESYEIKKFDGQNWESFFKNADISKFSSLLTKS